MFLSLIPLLFALAVSGHLRADEAPEHSGEEPLVDDTPAYGVNTFYALLVAEMAGQRQLYDLALGNYLLEAHRTQDPGVTARATYIAQYIGADQAALDAATLWVKLDALNPEAHLALSQELVKAARFSESVLHIQKALDLTPDLNVSFIAVQGNQLTEGSRELWLENLHPLTTTYKDNLSLLFSVASLHQQQNNLQVALETIDQLLAQNPNYYPAWTSKARIQASQGDTQGALSSVAEALKQFPDDKSLTILKARLLIKEKDIAAARDTFLSLAQQSPRDAHVLLPLALTHLELNELDMAKVALQKLLNLHEMENEAHYYLGRIAQQEENYVSALNHYLAMTGGREFLAAQNGAVKMYLELQRFDEALAHVKKLREMDSSHRQAYFLMEVELLNRTGRYEESISVLNDALAAYADDTDLRYSRAMVSEKLGNIDQLEADLGYIIDKDPNNATALNALGYTLADRTARLDEALKLINKARDIAPSDPAITDSLGWVYYRMGRLQEALKLLQEAYAAFPDPEVAAHLGEVLWALDQKQLAKEIWQEGLQKQPDSQIIHNTLKRLKVKL